MKYYGRELIEQDCKYCGEKVRGLPVCGVCSVVFDHTRLLVNSRSYPRKIILEILRDVRLQAVENKLDRR
jgi:hypothetical protein